MSRNFKVIVIFFVVFFPLQQSLAQVYSIEGFVKDINNTTLPNITIVLKGLQNSISPQRIFTDSLGYYRFDNIMRGRYTVAAESQEYGRSVSDTIELGAVSPKAVHPL